MLAWVNKNQANWGDVGAGVKCRGDASRRFSDLRMTSEFRWPCGPEAEAVRFSCPVSVVEGSPPREIKMCRLL